MIDDLLIAGPPAPSPRLAAALVVIGISLHETFAKQPGLKPEISLRSCILASVTVRDFLRRIGFNADVASCLCFIEAYDLFGTCRHTLGIGTEKEKAVKSPTGWSGHLVATAENWLIDTTLFPAAVRPGAWEIPGMIAAPMQGGRPAYGMNCLAAISAVDPQDGSYTQVRWLDQPRNRLWKRAPDLEPWRRMPVVNHMVRLFEEGNFNAA